VFWSLIRDMMHAAERMGRPASVSGEAAGNPALLAKFMDAGVEAASVSARVIPDEAIYSMTNPNIAANIEELTDETYD